ncbi:MAG: WD40 repeat domain-containing protein [Candidatus Poribacteria bacterium]|nr:WD40 repeat domain-containing protein [Candidatus Poribacteria bacterium]
MDNKNLSTSALQSLHNTDVTTWELPEGALARFGHGLRLDVEFSHDAAYFTVATKIGFWIYDTETLTPRALWGTDRGMMNVATFSHDSRWIATGDQDGILKVWDTQNGQCVARTDWGGTERRNVIRHVRFSPDDQFLAASGFGDSAVYAWHTELNAPIRNFKLEKPKLADYRKEGTSYDRYFPIAFSPNSNLFAYVSSPEAVTVSDINTSEEIAHLTGHTTPLHTLLFSPCGQYLASASLGSTVQIWDIQNESLSMTPKTYEGNRIRLAYTPDETLRVAEIYNDKVVIWDASRHVKLDTFNTVGNTDSKARFSNDGKKFAITCRNRKIQIWHEDDSTTKSFFSGYGSIPYSVAFMQDNKTLIGGNWGGTGKIFWDINKREVDRILPPSGKRSSSRRCMTLSPDDQLLAIDTGGNDIQIWNIESEVLVTELTGHKKDIYSLTFSPTGEYLVSGGTRDELYVWDIARWKKQHTLIGHTSSIEAIAFHPDGKQFVTSSRDGTALLWNVETGEQISPLPLPETLEDAFKYRGEPQEIERVMNGGNLQYKKYQHMQSIVFSPCGNWIAGGLGTWMADALINEIRLWDTETLETRMILLQPHGCIRPWALAFSPCGKHLASGAWWKWGLDKAPIHLWEMSTGENIHTFWGHASDVQDLAYSPDGKYLASGSYDGTVLLWDMKPFIDSN